MVPGVVFLGVMALLLGLSGTFSHLDTKSAQVGVALLAAVVAAGLAGYPLGLVLNIPYDLVFRGAGNYNRFIDYHEFSSGFSAIAPATPSPAFAVFRAECVDLLGHPSRERRFFGFFFERFAPDAVRKPSQGRWETFHTVGGMISAIVFAFALSPAVILTVQHDNPWWDREPVRFLAPIFGCLVALALLTRAVLIAIEAGDMQKRWGRYFLDLLARHPEALDLAAADNPSISAGTFSAH